MDETELNAIVESCLEGCKMTADNFGLAFCYTGTDETFFYQGDNHFYSASLYKLPLCMRYAERLAEAMADYSLKLDDRLAELQALETPEPLPTATPQPTETPATPPVTEPPVVESAAKSDGKGVYCVCGAAVLLLCGIIMRKKRK